MKLIYIFVRGKASQLDTESLELATIQDIEKKETFDDFYLFHIVLISNPTYEIISE
jgi:hypothetical protein